MQGLVDEELDLLLVLCEEASANFEYLTELFFSSNDERMSSVFTKENNEERQKSIQDLKESILKEKVERKLKQNNDDKNDDYETKVSNLLNESFQKQIDELQKKS